MLVAMTQIKFMVKIYLRNFAIIENKDFLVLNSSSLKRIESMSITSSGTSVRRDAFGLLGCPLPLAHYMCMYEAGGAVARCRVQ